MIASSQVDRIVPLDELFPSTLARETDLDGMIRPCIGWFLLTLITCDLMANVIGLPIMTGWLVSSPSVPIVGYLIAALVVFQICTIAGVFLLLWQTPWRIWIDELVCTARKTEGRSLCMQPINFAGRLWEGLVGAPIVPVKDSEHLGLAIFGMLLVTTFVVVGLIWPGGLVVVLLAFLLVVGRSLLRVTYCIIRRAVADRSSMTGLVLGLFVCGLLILAVANSQDLAANSMKRAWSDPVAGWFRTVELFVVVSLICWTILLPAGKLNHDLKIFVGAPSDHQRVYYDLGNFQSLTGRRVVARFDQQLVPELIVLVRQRDSGYIAVNADEKLLLNERCYVVVYLGGLQDAVQNGAREPLNDAWGFFQPTVTLHAAPRAIEPAKLPITFAPGKLDSLLGLLGSSDLKGELLRLAQDAYDTFANRMKQTGAGLDIKFRQLEGSIDNIPLRLTTGADVSGNVLALDAVQLNAGLLEQQQKEAALTLIDAKQQEGADLAMLWLETMQRQLTAAPGVSMAFESLFRQRYITADTDVEMVANRLGLSLRAILSPLQNTAPRGDEMLASLNDQCAKVRNIVLADVKSIRERNTRLVMQLMKLRDTREIESVKVVIQMLPEILPYFGRRTDDLLKFFECVLGNSRMAIPSQDHVRTLLVNFRSTSSRSTGS